MKLDRIREALTFSRTNSILFVTNSLSATGITFPPNYVVSGVRDGMANSVLGFSERFRSLITLSGSEFPDHFKGRNAYASSYISSRKSRNIEIVFAEFPGPF